MAITTKPKTKADTTKKKNGSIAANPPAGLNQRQADRYAYIFRTQGQEAATKAADGFVTKNQAADPNLVNSGRRGVNNEATNYNLDTSANAMASGQIANERTAAANAQMNRPTQQGQYGGQKQWTQDENGNWIVKTSMGQDAQTQTDLGNQMTTMGRQSGVNSMGQAAQNYANPYGYNGISQVMGGQQLGDARNKAAQSAYESQMALMRPERDQQNSQFEQMAAERGWVPGSKVYENEKNRLQSQQSMQDKSLAESSYNTGLGEYNTMFNTSTQDRARQIQEMNAQRDRPLQEAQSMFNSGPGVQQDQFADYGPITQDSLDASKYYGIDQQGQLQTDNQSWQTREKALDRAAQLKAAGMAASAARSGGGENLTAAQQMQRAQQQMEWERNNGFRPDYRNTGSSSSGSWNGAIQGIATGVGAGIGNSIKW